MRDEYQCFKKMQYLNYKGFPQFYGLYKGNKLGLVMELCDDINYRRYIKSLLEETTKAQEH